MRQSLAALALSLCALPAGAQSWGDLDTLIMNTLTGGAPLEASRFMPDASDPQTATRALVIAYTHIPGSAGSVAIHTGVYKRYGSEWILEHPVDGVFGMGAEDPVFGPTHVEVTTGTLAPGDARCCPTGRTRWRIDTETGAVTKLN